MARAARSEGRVDPCPRFPETFHRRCQPLSQRTLPPSSTRSTWPTTLWTTKVGRTQNGVTFSVLGPWEGDRPPVINSTYTPFTHTHTRTSRGNSDENLTPFLPPAGVSNLIQQVCRLSKGLRLLNLSKTSLTSKGSGLCSLVSIPVKYSCVQIVSYWNI